jgi:hypothetical protein
MQGVSMQPEELTRRIQHRPFVPFRMFLTDGSIYDVRHPELLMVGKRTAVVGMTANPQQKLFDHLADIDLLHVVRVEPIESSAPKNGQ